MSISESDLYDVAMLTMAQCQNGEITTSNLIMELEEYFLPDGHDAAILTGRNDSHFSQKVRNIKSHKTSPTNPIAQGLVEDIKDGMKITDAGRKYLRSLGHNI